MNCPRSSRRNVLHGLAALGLAPLVMANAGRTAAAVFPAVRALLKDIVTSRTCPGVAVTIGHGTSPPTYLSEGALGFGSGVSVDENTLWRAYSMTKPVAGMAAMLLIAQGRMRLDQPIADFLPEFASMRVLVNPASGLDSRPASKAITIRHLVTHTSGIGSAIPVFGGPLADTYIRTGLKRGVLDSNGKPDVEGAVASLDEFCRRLATVPLEAEPGTRWRYSFGLDVLGRIVEVVSGQPFDAFLHQAFFEPLDMRSTWFRVPGGESGRFADSYGTQDGKAVLVDSGADSRFLQQPAYPSGGGGLVSSARDYDRFLAMLMGGGTFEGTAVIPPGAVDLGMSNLLPDGVDMSAYIHAGSDDGFGAGGRVVMSGPDKGAFGWMGAAGTLGMVNRKRQIRLTGMLNRMDNMTLPQQLPGALNSDLGSRW